MIFTFLVLTYMHEKYILETLESIKFQINKYGHGLEFQLIVSDDASSDKTIFYVNKWVNENKNLFKIIDIVTFDENKGANFNFSRGYSLVKGKMFKFIEGDDLFSYNNIFDAVEKLQEADLIYGTVLPFKDRIISKDKSRYDNIAFKSIYTSKKLKFLTKVSCPIGGGSLVEKKELLTDEVIKLVSNFRLVGDRTKLYKYFIDNLNITYKFEIKPLILYRHSDTSISQNKDTVTNRIHNEDIIGISKMINLKSRNLLVKYINFCNIKALENKIFIYLNPLVYYNKILRILNYKKISQVSRYLMNEIDKNQEYLNSIVISAEAYKEK